MMYRMFQWRANARLKHVQDDTNQHILRMLEGIILFDVAHLFIRRWCNSCLERRNMVIMFNEKKSC